MTTDQVLDRIVVPRPNGSEALEQVAAFLAEALARSGASVSFQEFTATPHGFQLVWSAALLAMAGWALAVWRGRYRLALLLPPHTAALLLAEFEGLRSPVSGLAPARERNVIGSYPGRAGGPTLVFSAHYDSATHFGDHLDWGRWGFLAAEPAREAVVDAPNRPDLELGPPQRFTFADSRRGSTGSKSSSTMAGDLPSVFNG